METYMTEEWFALLKTQIKAKTAQAVAVELGYSKTALSLIMNGKYVGKTDRVRDAVMNRYAFVECPHRVQTIAMYDCISLAHSPAPTHNPIKMQQWRACQSCPKRPKETAK